MQPPPLPKAARARRTAPLPAAPAHARCGCTTAPPEDGEGARGLGSSSTRVLRDDATSPTQTPTANPEVTDIQQPGAWGGHSVLRPGQHTRRGMGTGSEVRGHRTHQTSSRSLEPGARGAVGLPADSKTAPRGFARPHMGSGASASGRVGWRPSVCSGAPRPPRGAAGESPSPARQWRQAAHPPPEAPGTPQLGNGVPSPQTPSRAGLCPSPAGSEGRTQGCQRPPRARGAMPPRSDPATTATTGKLRPPLCHRG